MQYVKLGRTGVDVSPVCLGTMMFGGPADEADSIHIIHKAIDQGINFIDTANMYNAGRSEEITGKAIADRRRRVVLATKGRQAMNRPASVVCVTRRIARVVSTRRFARNNQKLQESGRN